MQRIACQESQQREFSAAANGGLGPVLISPDNGVGIFQLTNPDPFPTPALLFNWKSNVAAAVSLFNSKLPGAKGYPKQLRTKTDYQTAIDTEVNPARMNSKLKPITILPAPEFTVAGVIGATPSNQLLEDSTRGYNGYGGPRFLLYGAPLHEFMPNLAYLKTVPDAQLPSQSTDPLVWTRVDTADRNPIGANYVSDVEAKSARCGG